MKDVHHPGITELTLPDILAALGDPIRLGIVRTLADGRERGWGELQVPVGKSTLSHHLKTLRAAGITKTRQEGTRCFVSLRSVDLDSRFPGVLASILAAGDEPTHEARPVTLEPTRQLAIEH